MGLSQEVAASRRRLEALRRSLTQDVVRLLRRLNASAGRLEGVADSLSNAVTVRSQVLELLRAEGAPIIVSELERATDEAAAEALRNRRTPKPKGETGTEAVGITLEARALATVRQSVSGLLDDIPPLWANAADEVRAAIDRGVSTGARLDDLVAEVSDRLAITITQSAVVLEAAVRAGYTRATVLAAEAAAQEAGEEMGYLYDGPEDAKTRPFCERVIGKVYTLAALRRLDNGQGLPVETHRGGYRCRHRLSPILLSDAEAEGYEVTR